LLHEYCAVGAYQLVEASTDPDGGWHTEACHAVQHVAANFFCFDLLTGQSPGQESPSNDGFVPIHRSLNEASSVVARTHFTAGDSGSECERGDCSHRKAWSHRDAVTDRHPEADIVRRQSHHHRRRLLSQTKKTHYFRYVADIVLRQFDVADFMRVGIDAEMQFAANAEGKRMPRFWSSHSLSP
jgi:hypothetical protein